MSQDWSSSRGEAQATPTGSRGLTPSISPAAKARSGSANSLLMRAAATAGSSGRPMATHLGRVSPPWVTRAGPYSTVSRATASRT